MKSLNFTAALAALAAPLLLAACGGGGGGGSSSAGLGPVTGPSIASNVGGLDPTKTQTAVASAGKAAPGYGSVFQSSNNRATSVTFTGGTGGRLDLTVRRDSSPNAAPLFSLNSHDNNIEGISSTNSETPIPGHRAVFWPLGDIGSATRLSGTVIFLSWNEDVANDWLAGGYWLHARGNINTRTITSMEAGAFIDGPEFDDRTSMPSSGTATYTGIAGGIYARSVSPTDVQLIELEEARVTLNADFGASSPTIGGTIEVSDEARVTLGSTTFDATGRINPGSVGLTIADNTPSGAAVPGVTGQWGGRFSMRDDSESQPRAVAGTAGAEWTYQGISGAFVGAFLASKPQS